MYLKDVKNRTLYKINKAELKPYKKTFLVYNKDRAMLFDAETKLLLLAFSDFKILLKTFAKLEAKFKTQIADYKKESKLQTKQNTFNKFINYDL
jgi:hypothetical protein